MSKFAVKNIPSIKGRQQFKQLVIVDSEEDLNNVQQRIDKLESSKKEPDVYGVLDLYELSLEDKYKSSFRSLLAIMDRIADLKPVSKDKFKDITPRGETVKEYEFKHQDLRVYGIKIPNGKMILLGGYKNQQPQDIDRFRSLKKQFLNS